MLLNYRHKYNLLLSASLCVLSLSARAEATYDIAQLKEDLKSFYAAVGIPSTIQPNFNDAIDNMDEFVLESIAGAVSHEQIQHATSEILSIKNSEELSPTLFHQNESENLSIREMFAQKTFAITTSVEFTPNYPTKDELAPISDVKKAYNLWSGSPKERCFNKSVVALKESIIVTQKVVHSLEYSCVILTSGGLFTGAALDIAKKACEISKGVTISVLNTLIFYAEKCAFIGILIDDAELEAAHQNVRTLLKNLNNSIGTIGTLGERVEGLEEFITDSNALITNTFTQQLTALNNKLLAAEQNGSTGSAGGGETSQLSSELLLDLFARLDEQQKQNQKLINKLIDYKRFGSCQAP